MPIFHRTRDAFSHRHGILMICCISLFLVSLDNSIVNVALPAMSREIGARITDLQWIVDAYTLVLASLLILGGSLGDRFGRKPVFMSGVTIFGLGSLLCSFAPSPSLLVAARIFQAVGGAMLNPVAMSIIANTFTDERERAMAIGVWGAVNGLGTAAGPLLGGLLVSMLGWRSVFWINVPIALVGVVLTFLFVPNSKALKPRRFDIPGQVSMLVFLASAIGVIIEGPRIGWLSPHVLLIAVLAIAALAVLLAWEARATEPLIDLKYFRNPCFSAAITCCVVAFTSIGGFMFLNTLYLQNTRGLPPLAAGTATLPVALMTIVFSTVSGKLVGSTGPRMPLAASGLSFALAAIMLYLLPDQASLTYVMLIYAIFGIGSGLVNAPITNTAVSGLPPSQAGVAAGIASTGRQAGTSLGVAIAGSIIACRAHDGGAAVASSTDASRPMWLLILIFGLLIGALSVLVDRQSPSETSFENVQTKGD
ncbi:MULTISPECIES: MFS transporter [Burkholderia]|uniref:MFS transporter n=1 Tax=Burkholderia TaxID=32008 RepID=UPI001CF0E317|nr:MULTISPECIES: MFS transporter [Burkholderia]MCA8037221.1 MFS transporter [Burkholderia arboris]MDN7702633.1 MFS transporter [Burkholderia sp. AU44665]